MVPRGRGLVPRPGLYSRDLCTSPKKIHGAAQGYQEPSGAKHTQNNFKRPCSQSGQIRPRPAGETITGWLDHSTAGAGGLEGASAGCGPTEPRTAGWLSLRTRGSRRRWVGFPHGRRCDLPRTAGSVSRGRRHELRKWRVGFPRQRRPAGMSQRQSGELESAAIRRA